MCAIWNGWQCGVFTIKASTVIGWHRKGFRRFWAWKVRRGKQGRPPVPREVRQLIRTMSRENPLWGAPRIHGELLKLGIDIGETSVSKYLVRRHQPPSQTWRTFLDNHVKSMVSVDFFCGADDPRKVKILEHAETMGDWPSRFERPWQDVTRQFWTRVTLCYISVPSGSLDNAFSPQP